MPVRFRDALLELSALQRRRLADFLGLLSRKRSIALSRGKFLRSLPLSEFETAEMELDYIENVSATLRALYGIPDTSSGISAVHYSTPKVEEEQNKTLVVNGLHNIPVTELLEELAEMKELPISFGRRVPICISEKKGIYRLDNPSERYEIRGSRLDLVVGLHSGRQPEPDTSVEKNNISRDVSDINALFLKKLRLIHPLIDHSDSFGYFLNEDAYELILELLSTKAIAE